jgi:hypothetical protein
MKVRDKFSRDQLRWSDISWGEVDGDWPAISFARGTGAFSQLEKISDGDAVLSVCAGQGADRRYKRRITGISVPTYFTAPTVDLVEPELYERVTREHGRDRWPESIACAHVYRLHQPMPTIDDVLDQPRMVTVTRGRYLANLETEARLFDLIADLEIDELPLYRSQRYATLANQPRNAAHRRAGWSPDVPRDIQALLLDKVNGIFNSAAASGRVYEYEQPERKVPIEKTDLLLILIGLWTRQDGRCQYCQIPLETSGLAQVSVDRINNENREYGRHNVQLTCLECNRGKHTASHQEMLDLWEKRAAIWSVAEDEDDD